MSVSESETESESLKMFELVVDFFLVDDDRY